MRNKYIVVDQIESQTNSSMTNATAFPASVASKMSFKTFYRAVSVLCFFLNPDALINTLAHPDFQKAFLLSTDAYMDELGAVLSQTPEGKSKPSKPKLSPVTQSTG